MSQYIFEHEGVKYYFKKDESDKDKCIVFACAKNEDEYIVEWVEHYKKLGFDKIIIADNNDSPASLKEILSEYIESGFVQIFPCNGLKRFQLYIYNMYLKEGNYIWCAYFDCDEFLELTVHKDIKDFLSGIKENTVVINWVIFGSNGKINKENLPVQERFKVPANPVPLFKENFYVKPIVRGGEHRGEYMTNSHCPFGTDSINIGGYCPVNFPSIVYTPPRYKYAYIKHYYTKSFNEWMSNKVKRGWPDEMLDILKPSNYFIVDKNPEFQIDKYTNGFFIDNNEFSEKEFHEKYDATMNTYEMIELLSTDNNVYSLVLHAFSFMRYYTNHLIVIKNENIDDCTFGNMLEYALITGNRVCFAFDDSDVEKAFVNKTTWNKKLFYYMNCL